MLSAAAGATESLESGKKSQRVFGFNGKKQQAGLHILLIRTEMKYTKLYATEDGESHFEHVEIDLSLLDYAPPAPPLELSAMKAATQFGFMQAPSGWSSDWHPSSARNFFVVLSGEWEVTASDGESRRFGAGSLLLVDDTTGRGHSSRVTSETASLAVMVELGE